MSPECPRCHSENTDTARFCSNCATPLTLDKEAISSKTVTFVPQIQELKRGSLFAERYEVIEELGTGGMGKVYRVVDKKIDEEVALKLLRPEITSDERNIERFRNELKYSRKISHTNVCRMYHLGEAEGAQFITMEYVPGEDLKTSIRRMGPLSTGKAIKIIKQVCEGLAEAHKHGVVHRDLKPHNIMIDKQGNAKIMDFGIVRSLHTDGITQSGIMIGTPTYMSPEQAEGKPATPISDIYSIGVILFELVTGRVPFEGDTALTLALKHKTEPVPDPREINAQISVELSHVIFKCMEKSPANRYQNAKELIDDLNVIKSSMPTTSKVIPKKESTLVMLKKRQKLSKRIGLLSVFAVVLVGGYFLLSPVFQSRREARALKKPIEDEFATQKSEAEIAKLGKIDLHSEPAGADIYIENKLVGRTPLQLDLSPGLHSLTLKKGQDYQEVTDKIEVKESETFTGKYTLARIVRQPESKTEVSRAPPVFVLEIETTPEGALVSIDGEQKGQTPFKIELDKSSCQLRIEKGEEWSVLDEPLNLRQGLNSIHRDLKRIKYSLSIQTIPSEAEVIFADESLGITPLEKLVSTGAYILKVKKDGYRTIEEPIAIIDSDILKKYDLVRLQTGTIRIKVQPFATVFINGESIGEVPPVKTQEITEGRHTIEFVSETLDKKYKVEVEIGPGEGKEVKMNMETGESTVVIIEKNNQ